MVNIKDIIQHYNPNDHQDIIRLINGFNEVENKQIVKDLGFLNPNLLQVIEEFSKHYPDIKVVYDGGYDEAIRKKVIIFPSFYEDIDSEIILYQVDYVNKFQTLSHPQILGTLLNNGIRESIIGDIIVNEEGIIEIVVDRSLDDTIHYLINKVNNLSVSFKEITEIDICRKLPNLNVYKARSLRIDCVLKAVLKISRVSCTKLLKQSRVRLNYSVIQDVTQEIKEGDVLSVRGHGHFEIEEIRAVNKGFNIFYS